MTVWCTGFPDPNSPSVEPWRPSLLTCACAPPRPLSLPLTVWFPQGDTPEGHSISHLCDSDPLLLVRFPLVSMATQLSSPPFCLFCPLPSYWFPCLPLLLVTGCTQSGPFPLLLANAFSDPRSGLRLRPDLSPDRQSSFRSFRGLFRRPYS